MTKIIRVDVDNLTEESLLPAVEILRSGGVVAYPTETFYGLGVDALNPEAIKKIFAIKNREISQPILALIPGKDHLSRYVHAIPKAAFQLIEDFWPGPLTLVFFSSSLIPPILTAHTQKIALRISSHPVAQTLTSMLNTPLTSTSANISGAHSPITSDEVLHQLAGKIDLIVDGGPTSGGMPSTIIDVTFSPPQLVREGAIPYRIILEYLGISSQKLELPEL